MSQIDAELSRLIEARKLVALAGRVDLKNLASTKATAKPAKKRVMSAEARKRIADAQHRRWAAQKAKSK